MKKPPPRAPLRLTDYPDTYEKLVTMLQKQHPKWTRAEVEAYIRDAQQRQGAR
jgi:hypothetical protein